MGVTAGDRCGFGRVLNRWCQGSAFFATVRDDTRNIGHERNPIKVVVTKSLSDSIMRRCVTGAIDRETRMVAGVRLFGRV